MNATRKILLSMTLLPFFMSPALAQNEGQISQDAMFGVFLSSPAYRAFLENAFNASEPPPLKAQCAAMKIIKSDAFSPIQQPTFSKNGNNLTLLSGSWLAFPVFDACGKTVKRRALVRFLPETNTLQPIRLLPGDFIGDLKLEGDARRIIFPGLLAKAHCNDSKALYILNIEEKSSDKSDVRVESWTAEACGQPVQMDVTYAKSADGIVIQAQVQ